MTDRLAGLHHLRTRTCEQCGARLDDDDARIAREVNSFDEPVLCAQCVAEDTVEDWMDLDDEDGE